MTMTKMMMMMTMTTTKIEQIVTTARVCTGEEEEDTWGSDLTGCSFNYTAIYVFFFQINNSFDSSI